MPNYTQDFREIAHCGGQVIITVRRDVDGGRAIRFGFRNSRPVRASISGIYSLLPHGIACGDFRFGGMGMDFDPPTPGGCIPVFLASDSEGKYARCCPSCDSMFRNESGSAEGICCPYCRLIEAPFQFLTSAQLRYIKHYTDVAMNAANQDFEPGTDSQIIIDMDAVVDADPNIERPPFYYASESQQTAFNCNRCGQFNDIRGMYGYCSMCWTRNNAFSLKNSLNSVRELLNSGGLSEIDAVKLSVSAFDACCRDLVRQLTIQVPMRRNRCDEFGRLKFHSINGETFNRIKSMFDIDVLRGINDEDIKFINLMMHRRHVYEHNGGVADNRYVTESGDLAFPVGVLIRETKENANRFIGLLNRMTANFQSDFHELFEVNEGPIRGYEEHQRWTRAAERD